MKKFFCISFLLILTTCLFAQSKAGGGDTAEAYALEFFKHFNETQKKLTYMNKKGSLAKVGTETVEGKISGTVFYDVKLKGLGADVTLRYTNYCDEEGWTFDGEIITHSNMSQNGSFEGSIKVSGLAPGEIIYDQVKLVKGNPGAGDYLIRLPGQSEAPASYKVYLKSKE